MRSSILNEVEGVSLVIQPGFINNTNLWPQMEVIFNNANYNSLKLSLHKLILTSVK